MVYEHDGTRLGRLMRRAGVTNSALAEAVGSSLTAVGKWIKTGKFARENVVPICRALGCTADELLGLTSLEVPVGVSDAPTSPEARELFSCFMSASAKGQRTILDVAAAVAAAFPKLDQP